MRFFTNEIRVFLLLKVKKMKKAKSSDIFVDCWIWSKKQKWSYEPTRGISTEYKLMNMQGFLRRE